MAFLYDVSRLVARGINPAPNGIDRVDAVLARQFLAEADAHALLFGVRGPRLFPAAALPDPVAAAEMAWREDDPSAARVSDDLVAALAGGAGAGSFTQPTRGKTLRAAKEALAAFARYGWRQGNDPAKTAPPGAVYLNASHFPLDWPRHTSWLQARPDVKPVFFIHDLLPLRRPDDFWASEPARHARRLQLLARRGAGAVVASAAVEADLQADMVSRGRRDLPIHRAALPVGPIFHQPPTPDTRLVQADYFVVCGTIEPRKNHRLLVAVWRRLIADLGSKAPKLVVVGKRGWRCEAILAALSEPVVAGHILLAPALPTPAYRTLLGYARALLAPSQAEGFDIPMAEARASGVPVLASDIAAHREHADGDTILIDPGKPDDWLAVIKACGKDGRDVRPALARSAGPAVAKVFADGIMAFARSL